MTDIKSVSIDVTRGIDRVITDTGYTDDNTLETAVILSLFTDGRANESDNLAVSDDPRGVWSDSVTNPRTGTGSRRWLLSRSKQNNDTLLKLIDYDTEALQWMIDSGIASDIKVTAEWAGLGLLAENITITTKLSELTLNITARAGTNK